MNRPTLGQAALGRLVLELRHPTGLAEAGQAFQHPGQLSVGRHVRLDEQRRPLRIDAERQQLSGGDPGAPTQQRRILLDRDRVQVDDE